MKSDYDQTDARSILGFALTLTGKTLSDFITEDERSRIIENKSNKGDLGNLVEKYYFKINPGNSSAPDFPDAGVELKTTAVLPYKKRKQLKSGDRTLLNTAPDQYRAKERLKLTTINYTKIVNENWIGNSLFKKCETILLLLTLYEAGVLMIDRRFIAQPLLWNLPDKDMDFIRNDWMTIVSKIQEGRAHELSGSDTYYLEACTSGSGRLKNQPHSDIKAKERSFAFKSSYVTASFLSGAKFIESLEPIIQNGESPRDFESLVIKRVHSFKGLTVNDIAEMLKTDLSKSKQYLALLSYAMLSIETRRAEEFVKAGIEIKTINLRPNGTPGEDVSFPALSYMDIVNEEWEDSVFKQKIDTKVLFMIFQKDSDGMVRFLKSIFWSMPLEDIMEAKRVWEETKKRVASGNADKLPLKDFSDVSHVRNHGTDSKPKNRIPTPSNGMLPVKGFWLNAGYVKNQIKEDIL